MWLRQETSTLPHNRVIKANGTGCRACPFWCPDRTQRRKEAPSDITRCRYYWSSFVFSGLTRRTFLSASAWSRRVYTACRILKCSFIYCFHVCNLSFKYTHKHGCCHASFYILTLRMGNDPAALYNNNCFFSRDLSAAACADAEKWIKHNSDLQEDPRCAGSFLFSSVDGTILVRISSWSENSRPGRKKSVSQNFH